MAEFVVDAAQRERIAALTSVFTAIYACVAGNGKEFDEEPKTAPLHRAEVLATATAMENQAYKVMPGLAV